MWYFRPEYIALAQRIGATGLLIKAADGTQPWSQWGTAAETTRAAGLEPVPWAYNYGDPAEVDVLVALDEPIICVDPEIEFEGMPSAGQAAFIARLAASGKRIWAATWARPEVHGAYPFTDLARVCEALLPMVAWQVWQPRSASFWLDDWALYGWPSIPWLPTTEGVTPDELAQSVTDAIARFGGASIWEASTLTPALVEALARRVTVP